MPTVATEHATTFQELPTEILDIIANRVYDGSHGQIDGLLAFSLVSRLFRRSALPFLFKTVSHVVRDHLDQNEHGALRRLLKHPHLLRYIQIVHIVRPTNVPRVELSRDHASSERLTREHTIADFQVLWEGLSSMTRLRRIRLDCSTAVASQTLEMLPAGHIYEVVFDHLYASSNWPNLVEATTELALLAKDHRLGLGAFREPPAEGTTVRHASYEAITRAVAIDLHMAWLLKDNLNHQTPGTSSAPRPRIAETPSWTELRLLVQQPSGTTNCALRDLDVSVVPWENLRRLSIVWKYTMHLTQFIHDIAPLLTNLHALRIQADHQRAYDQTCRYDIPDGGVYAWNAMGPTFQIDYSHMKQLRELEIDGICHHVLAHRLIGRSLRSLRLHREDALWSVYPAESQLPHGDVLLATTISPDLERLELDIGWIENLWHPTAIPGVDVDVEQYAFLNAISKFRRLRYLRLFPPCVARRSPRFRGPVRHCVPVSDDQAVRMFEHLRAECPSLEMVSIAASPSFVDIDTMCWEVKRCGDKNILTTKHRERNYQHRQVWVGQRRISSEIKRFSTTPTYLPDPEGWILTRPELHDVR